MNAIYYDTKFDKEYQTQWMPEIMFLRARGIKHTFIKTVKGITTYKYEKNGELFSALAEFYSR